MEHLGGEGSFKPFTLSALLAMLERVLYVDPCTSGEQFYIINPDTAQCIVLKWGSCVPWSWRKWSDERVLDSEQVVKLVSEML